MVRVLVESGVKVNQLQDGASPLFIASQNGHVEVVRYLLCDSPCKPNKDLANNDGATCWKFGNFSVSFLCKADGQSPRPLLSSLRL